MRTGCPKKSKFCKLCNIRFIGYNEMGFFLLNMALNVESTYGFRKFK
jgi:hypothetical protein